MATNKIEDAKIEETKAIDFDPNNPLEAEAAAAGMTVEQYLEEPVDYMAPIIYGQKDQTCICGINSETIRFKRGVHVKIKRKFVKMLEDSERQTALAYESMEKAQAGESL